MKRQQEKINIQTLLSNQNSFNEYMEKIDQGLSIDDVMIPARPLKAMGVISEELNCSLVLGGEFSNKIESWYDSRYGKRVLMDFSIGQIVILIKNNPYIVSYPLAFGTVKIYPFRLVEGLTPTLLMSLSQKELDETANIIIKNYTAFASIDEKKFLSISDMDIAVNQIMNKHHDYGQSKWASLQIVEKALKTFIKIKGETPPKIHDLYKLLKQAEKLGLQSIECNMIDKIQCSPSCRYGEEIISLNESVEALHTAINVCSLIANYL